jgi:hypothetical protein
MISNHTQPISSQLCKCRCTGNDISPPQRKHRVNAVTPHSARVKGGLVWNFQLIGIKQLWILMVQRVTSAFLEGVGKHLKERQGRYQKWSKQNI